MRSLSVLFAFPWIYSGVYFGVVAALMPRHIVRDPNLAATYWMFGMVLVSVVSVIASLNIKRRLAGAARLGLMLLVVTNLIAATAVSAGLFARLFRLREAKNRDGEVVQRVNHADLERARRISRRTRTCVARSAASAVMTIQRMPAGAGVFR